MGPIDNKAGTMVIGYNAILRWLAKSTHPVSAKSSLRLFYMCQCGFYIYSIFALIAWETRRKDFAVMMSHHVVTSV
uniref:TLC domain-containing protein n=1 Tax=Aegilops tauschii subsp. strangulata TaxID=200361 RepID=A0A453IFW9_AEGTS